MAQKEGVEALARQHTAIALQALVDIVQGGESEAARVSAALAILDRGYGKPRQAIEHSDPNGQPIDVVEIRVRFVDEGRHR